MVETCFVVTYKFQYIIIKSLQQIGETRGNVKSFIILTHKTPWNFFLLQATFRLTYNAPDVSEVYFNSQLTEGTLVRKLKDEYSWRLVAKTAAVVLKATRCRDM